MSPRVDPPAVLPVPTLSLSSIRLFMQCPERWRRRYLEREYEPVTGRMLLGSAVGAAEAQHYSRVLETGEGLSVEDVLDEFAAEFDERAGRDTIDWEGDKPGELKDSGASVLAAYHQRVAPLVVPVSVEREFNLSFRGVEWSVTGFMDVEDVDGRVRDLKVRGKRLSQREADTDLQPAVYLLARRAEGSPATGFVFDTMVRQARGPLAEPIMSARSDEQLDRMVDRLFAVAAEIAWRAENDQWNGAAPGTWFCSRCGYHDCKWRL